MMLHRYMYGGRDGAAETAFRPGCATAAQTKGKSSLVLEPGPINVDITAAGTVYIYKDLNILFQKSHYIFIFILLEICKLYAITLGRYPLSSGTYGGRNFAQFHYC